MTSLRVSHAWLLAAPCLIKMYLLAYSGPMHVAAAAKSHTSMVKYCHKCDLSLPCFCCRYVTVPVFDDASYDQIEAEVLRFFNMTEIVTPDEVRGNYSTLSDAVLVNSRYAFSASYPAGILERCSTCCSGALLQAYQAVACCCCFVLSVIASFSVASFDIVSFISCHAQFMCTIKTSVEEETCRDVAPAQHALAC